MKKIIALALVAVMVLAFAACAKQNGENSTTAPSDDQKRQPQSALEILEKVWSKYSTDEKFPATGGSEKNIKDMMTSQFRSGREKTRKREISRDFSRFFDPEFFRSFIDPFCPFRCCVRTRTHEKGFFFFFFCVFPKAIDSVAGFGLAKAAPVSAKKLPLHKLFTNTIDPSSNCLDLNS